MSKPSPIQSLLELANSRVDEATRRLGELLNSQRSADDKLQLLQQYRSEYRERYLEAAKNGIDPAAIRNYSNFIGRLDDAIAQQQKMLDHQKSMTQLGQEKWASERNRMKAFDTLSQREQKTIQRKESRQEQLSSDEHSAKQHHKRAVADEDDDE